MCNFNSSNHSKFPLNVYFNSNSTTQWIELGDFRRWVLSSDAVNSKYKKIKISERLSYLHLNNQ